MPLQNQGIIRKAFNRWYLDIEGIGEVELCYNVHQNRLYREYVQKIKQRVLAKAKKEKEQAPKIEASTASQTALNPVVLKTDDEFLAEVLESIIQNRLTNSPEENLEVCHIAMNPDPDPKKESFSCEKINELFDLDIQGKIAGIWRDKKVMNPAFCKILDPHLAPLENKEAKEEGPRNTA